jgi:hypothetical protein
MNTRERFLEVMGNFNKKVPSVKWEFGYWGGTLNNWYEQGLPKNNYAKLPDKYTTPASSSYIMAWNCENKFLKKDQYPQSMPVTGGSVYSPTQGFPSDNDVRALAGLDKPQKLIDLNLMFHPMFDPKVLEETDTELKYLDTDGVKRFYLKKDGFPGGIEWPVKDMKSWLELKEKRVNINKIKDRFPSNWSELVAEYKNRDYVLAIGGYPHGFFGLPATIMGYDTLFYKYYDEPELIHDMLSTFTDMWIAIYSEVLKDVEVDVLHIWEDVSMGSGSMISVNTIREFMLPYYKKLTDFVKSRGVKVILVDTDGYCMNIIPVLMECGITGMYPFEVHTGMDVVEVRKKFPNLAMMGGIPKSEVAKGKDAIDRILGPIKEVIKSSGYIPHCDHFIPPDVALDDFLYYRKKLNEIIDSI